MSIQSEINRISNAVDSAYSAVNEKNGTLPEDLSVDNLSDSIMTIPIAIPLNELGDAMPEDVAAGKIFTSTAGLRVEGTRAEKDPLAPLDPVEVYNDTRPKDWQVIPTPNDNEIYLLVNAPKDGGGLLAFSVECTGSYNYNVTVYRCDSDGRNANLLSVSKMSGSTFKMEFTKTSITYSNISYSWGDNPIVTSDGMRQVLLKIATPENVEILSFASATHSKKTSPNGYVSWNIVEIKAKCPNLASFNCKNLYSLRYFSLTGINNITNMYEMFDHCYSLKAVSMLDASNATSMRSMFSGCYNLIAIPKLDTKNVTDMTNMFYDCCSLTSIPTLNIQNVTTTKGMFYCCSNLINVPVLNTQNVVDIGAMFRGCSSLTSIPDLDTKNVTDATLLFDSCRSLTVAPTLNTRNISSMDNIFRNSNNISVFKLISTITWAGCNFSISSCSFTRETIVELFNSLPTINASKTITLTGNPGVSDLTDEDKAIATSKGWTLIL